MKLLDMNLRLRRIERPARGWRSVGSSAHYDVYAVETDGEVFLGGCYRLGRGPNCWHFFSDFESTYHRGTATRQDCLWHLARLYRGFHPSRPTYGVA